MSQQGTSEVPAVVPEVVDVKIPNWDEAGLEAEGPVQFVIEEGKLAQFKAGENGAVRNVVSFQFKLVARPGRKLEPTPMFFDNFDVDAQWIRRFKALVKATRTSVPAKGEVSIAEIVRALKGKPAAGIIEHDSYKDKKTGEMVTKAKFGYKFAPSLQELLAR